MSFRLALPSPKILVRIGLCALFTASMVGCTGTSNKTKKNPDIVRSTDPVPPAPVSPAPKVWPYSQAPEVPDGFKAVRRLKVVSFPSGGSSLNNEASGALSEAVQMLKENSAWHILCVGHTDNAGESSSVGMSRAKAAASLFRGRGIDRSRIHTQSVGSAYAEAQEYETEQRKRDRKVEVWAFRP